jgi:hypothetical protein
MDEVPERVDLQLHNKQRDVLKRFKKRWGGSTNAAIRSCILIADEVVLKLERSPLTKDE